MSSELRSAMIAGVLLLVPAVYAGSYYALVDLELEGTNWHDIHPVPTYGALECRAAQLLYRPMFEVDKRLRAEYWRHEPLLIY